MTETAEETIVDKKGRRSLDWEIGASADLICLQ